LPALQCVPAAGGCGDFALDSAVGARGRTAVAGLPGLRAPLLGGRPRAPDARPVGLAPGPFGTAPGARIGYHGRLSLPAPGGRVRPAPVRAAAGPFTGVWDVQ